MFFALIYHSLRQRTIGQRPALLFSSFLSPSPSIFLFLPLALVYLSLLRSHVLINSLFLSPSVFLFFCPRLFVYRPLLSRVLEDARGRTYIFVKSKPRRSSSNWRDFFVPRGLSARLPACLPRDVLDLDLWARLFLLGSGATKSHAAVLYMSVAICAVGSVRASDRRASRRQR